jgi:hypothetical protein
MGMCERPGIPTSDAAVPSRANFNVDESQVRRTWEEFEYHVYISSVTNGAHIEHV